ncbi:unnamed protein product [Bursaphelenchus xylophilus]|uniref:(pine wood nematode) hypothetical protein n=1 Tax=Bursaphelenchus xylophilus TaxID=6326 RepID=A0A1I7SLV8_BURXY|nr:unnamed protein product [Bursaphelenchus xylophilus]CAG9129874.1 unnamed protein product [Bursaphelenchus xylophilus]
MAHNKVIKRLEERQNKAREIVLPNVIPWEYGSNKYASQTGSGGFGNIRKNVPEIICTRELTNSHNGNVPFHLCPPLKKAYASQAGQTPFGGFREQVLWVREHNDEEKKVPRDILTDWKATERSMPLLAKSNPNAKNDSIGKIRENVSRPVGGLQMGYKDMIKCLATVPRFQCMDQISSIRDANENNGEKMVGGLHHHRQIVTEIVGLNRTEQDQLDSNRYMAWLGGQLTLQSQARTGGFNKVRDVNNQTYYDHVLPDDRLSRQELEERRLNERNRRKLELGIERAEEEAVEESVAETVLLKPGKRDSDDEDGEKSEDDVDDEEEEEDDE